MQSFPVVRPRRRLKHSNKPIMPSSPKKKKSKKGHKKKNVKEEKDALQEVDRTMYNIQIADLTEKLNRYIIEDFNQSQSNFREWHNYYLVLNYNTNYIGNFVSTYNIFGSIQMIQFL